MVHVVTSLARNQKPRPKNVVFVGDFNVDERMSALAFQRELSTYDEKRLERNNN